MTALTPLETAVRTTCPYCGVGCGVIATPDGRGGASVAGDPEHPANFGRLCSKGSALGETLGLATRLLRPVVDEREVPWEEALDAVAERLSAVIARHGPGSVAFYLSGQLLTEDYYVANKLAKGFLGTPHVDTNSRLCMASSVAGHRRVFGSDTVPGAYEDLDEADLIVLVGSNAAWCHPVLFQRIQAARAKRGTRVVVVDPRRTATVDGADVHLAIAPGADTVLFAHLVNRIAALESESQLEERLNRISNGLAQTLAMTREIAPDARAVSAACGLTEAEVDAFVADWIATERVVTVYSQGVNQSAQGTDKVTTILAAHILADRIGRPGMGPFSFTGQPNAMGGREVGGLANMLAAHMGFSAPEVDRVRRFWDAPAIVTGEGLKAVQMFDAVADGRLKAVWVMGTNPAVSLPRADHVRAALGRLDLLVVSENVARNDTVLSGAHVRLPAAAWGEKNGTVTNSERRISRMRPFLPLAGDAKPDWWIMGEVARRLGFGSAFAYRSPAEIFAEHAALSAFENGGTRDFDIGHFAAVDAAAYDALSPVQWPVPKGRPEGTARLFADHRYYHADGKAKLYAPARPTLAAAVSDAYPLLLNTGRVRDQWHTMTRTGLSPRLGGHRPVPMLEVHPADAARHGLVDGGLVRVASIHGEATLEVAVADTVTQGQVFAPIHWTAETASHGRVGALVQSVCDPFSGQPEMKSTPVALAPVAVSVQGFALLRDAAAPPPPEGVWWSRVATEAGLAYVLAGTDADAIGAWFAGALPPGERAELADPARNLRRVAAFAGGRLEGALFLADAADRPRWDALVAAFAIDALGPSARAAVLSGRAPDGRADTGPLVCACFAVGLETIRAAIREGAADIGAIGAALKAGTNCGSCVPELRKILATEVSHAA
jgi:assimilatory nitrate reductase catalytic subunit